MVPGLAYSGVGGAPDGICASGRCEFAVSVSSVDVERPTCALPFPVPQYVGPRLEAGEAMAEGSGVLRAVEAIRTAEQLPSPGRVPGYAVKR